MPIPKNQLEKDPDKIKHKILEFLNKDPNFAYNIREIVEGIGISMKSNDFFKSLLATWGFGTILDEMVRKGLIDKNMNDGQILYFIH